LELFGASTSNASAFPLTSAVSAHAHCIRRLIRLSLLISCINGSLRWTFISHCSRPAALGLINHHSYLLDYRLRHLAELRLLHRRFSKRFRSRCDVGQCVSILFDCRIPFAFGLLPATLRFADTFRLSAGYVFVFPNSSHCRHRLHLSERLRHLQMRSVCFDICGFISCSCVSTSLDFPSIRRPHLPFVFSFARFRLRHPRLRALASDVSGIVSLPFCLADFVPVAFGFCGSIRCAFGCDLLGLSPSF
jgi:hypothetical protein